MRFWLSVLACAVFLVACGDDDSSSFMPCDSDNCSDEDSSSSQKSKSSSSTKSSNADSPDASGYLNPDISYGEITDKRDGQVYRTVKIGSQTWMAQNLNYRYTQKTSTQDSSSFCYNDKPENCEKFGRIYLWSAVMDSAGVFSDSANGCGYGVDCSPVYPVQGICPDGFHVPNRMEYEQLLASVGATLRANSYHYYYSLDNGRKLMSSLGIDDVDSSRTDDFGFSAIQYVSRGSKVDDFWTSTEENSSSTPVFSIGDSAKISEFDSKSRNLALRCVKTEKDIAVAIYPNFYVDKKTKVRPCKTVDADSCKYGSFIDSRDGQEYKTVQIGYMIWMAENLNYRYLQPSATEDSTSTCYNNDPEMCKKYGRLYSWSAAVDSAGLFSDGAKGCGNGVEECAVGSNPIRGVCPEGWHLPFHEDEELAYAAFLNNKISSQSEWDPDGIFPLGLNLLPSGMRDGVGVYSYMDMYAILWTAKSKEKTNATYLKFSSYKVDNDYEYHHKDDHFSVRCVRYFENYSPSESDSPVKFSSYDGSVPVAQPCPEDSSCQGTVVDERDGKTYPTIKIGDQWWMALNLDFRDVDYFCRSDCDTFGANYSWSVAMDSAGVYSSDGKGCGSGKLCTHSDKVRGICPAGWHLPSREEFWTLIAATGGPESSGKNIKSRDIWGDNSRGEDIYGFNAVPAYYTKNTESFGKESATTCYWSSTEMTDSTASCLYFNNGEIGVLTDKVYTWGMDKDLRYSQMVRCVKD